MSSFVRISDAASLALHAMALLASGRAARATAKELARELGGSEAHLSKVLQRLEKAGLVRSRRGPSGGFELAANASDVTLKEVFESIEGPLRETTCLLPRRICGGACMLGELLRKVDSSIGERLAGTSLADLRGFAAGPGARVRRPARAAGRET